MEIRVREDAETIMNNNTERGDGTLNEDIRYEEVRRSIARLKNGKAAGVDEIVKEVIKYGGEPVHIVIWQLIRPWFEADKSGELQRDNSAVYHQQGIRRSATPEVVKLVRRKRDYSRITRLI